MVFSSIVFLLYFFPVFITLYLLLDKRFKNLAVLFASILFYSWGAPLFIFVILGTTFIDFHLVKLMSEAEKTPVRNFFLALSVCMNLGLLFYFKYSFFLIENLNVILHLSGVKNVGWQKIALPIGISFFTFESLTYVIDVYRGVHAPLKKFWNYQLYIILFPKLIAGPIVRYHDIADQITDRFDKESIDKIFAGLMRFIIGLSKKVIIANSVAACSDHIFKSDLHSLNSATAWFGILCYAFQIYFDFSGYSDMAIGILKMIGFDIAENFNQPYSANSITDFWRRWHISLGAWMRNYLYIPLGGNRVKSQWRVYLNLWIVFLASGLWHGASWNFVIWGAYHGFWLVLERAFLSKLLDKIWNPVRVGVTFFLVVVGWVFFRAETLTDAVVFMQRMFAFEPGRIADLNPELLFFFVMAGLFSFIGISQLGRRLITFFYSGEWGIKGSVGWGAICAVLLILNLGFLAARGFNPFIYFRF
ncbi:MAG: rane bound O-acyl transferase family protein [Bacteroidota bacterium]|nr:rane bound O-acyl transferase family protein [Bacteroidota bacterium]